MIILELSVTSSVFLGSSYFLFRFSVVSSVLFVLSISAMTCLSVGSEGDLYVLGGYANYLSSVSTGCSSIASPSFLTFSDVFFTYSYKAILMGVVIPRYLTRGSISKFSGSGGLRGSLLGGWF